MRLPLRTVVWKAAAGTSQHRLSPHPDTSSFPASPSSSRRHAGVSQGRESRGGSGGPRKRPQDLGPLPKSHCPEPGALPAPLSARQLPSHALRPLPR